MYQIATALNPGKTGDLISVRLANGKVTNIIAGSPIAGGEVLVAGDRVFANTPQIVESRVEDLYRSPPPPKGEECEYLVASCWLYKYIADDKFTPDAESISYAYFSSEDFCYPVGDGSGYETPEACKLDNRESEPNSEYVLHANTKSVDLDDPNKTTIFRTFKFPDNEDVRNFYEKFSGSDPIDLDYPVDIGQSGVDWAMELSFIAFGENQPWDYALTKIVQQGNSSNVLAEFEKSYLLDATDGEANRIEYAFIYVDTAPGTETYIPVNLSEFTVTKGTFPHSSFDIVIGTMLSKRIPLSSSSEIPRGIKVRIVANEAYDSIGSYPNGNSLFLIEKTTVNLSFELKVLRTTIATGIKLDEQIMEYWVQFHIPESNPLLVFEQRGRLESGRVMFSFVGNEAYFTVQQGKETNRHIEFREREWLKLTTKKIVKSGNDLAIAESNTYYRGQSVPPYPKDWQKEWAYTFVGTPDGGDYDNWNDNAEIILSDIHMHRASIQSDQNTIYGYFGLPYAGAD